VKVKINLDGDSKLAIEGTLRLEGLLPDFKREDVPTGVEFE